MSTWCLIALAALAALLIASGCAAAETGYSAPEGVFRVRQVRSEDLRWRDISDQPYSPAFRRGFTYRRALRGLSLAWKPDPRFPAGHLSAKRLKPCFAYQLKLVGRVGVLGAEESDNAFEARALASYHLGHAGRWWCEQCRWNTSDWDIDYHLRQGHRVMGYLLFDWFVTDARGNAEVDLRAFSSHHVLWKASQRSPGRYDSRERTHQTERGSYGYAGAARGRRESVKLHAEWETERPLPGQLRLPAGEYEVYLNLTEESFHSGSRDGGGNWAQVLEAPVSFRLEDGRAAGASESPWSALRLWLGRSLENTREAAIKAIKP